MLPSIFGENLFDEFFGDPFMMTPAWNERNPLYGKHAKNLMKTDVRETETTYEVDVDLPGFKKEDVQIELRNGYLTITASKGIDREEDNKDSKFLRRERYSGSCSRSFYVGEGLRAEDVSAKYEDGILKLTMPKSAKPELPESSHIAIE